jgi:broad specificity phosphatase PhoE
MTRVLLIRHGQSEWNADGRWQGQADPPLTDLGRAQAHHAARSLGAVDAVVSSDLQRAAETAGIIAGALGVGPLVVDPDLRERDAGEWSGLTRVEIERDWPGYLGPPPPTLAAPSEDAPERVGPAAAATAQARRSTEPPRRPPGWESDESLRTRTIRALARIHDLVPRGDAIVVTHGGVVYALEGSFGAPFERLPNLGGRWIELGPDGPARLGERVVLVDPDEVTVPGQI